MKRKFYIWAAAAVCAFTVTACGDGSDVVINGTTAAQEESQDGGEAGTEDPASQEQETTGTSGGTRIDIITGETAADTSEETQPPETPPETTQAPTTAAPTTAAQTTAAPTTAAPTTAAQTTAAPTTAAPATTAQETTTAAEYTVRDVDKTMYANTSVRVRAGYSTSSDILGSLAEGESVQVTGESDNGWMRVSWNGQTAFVSKSYLSDDPPATTAAASETKPGAAQPGGTTPGSSLSPGGSTSPSSGGSTSSSGGGTSPSPGGNTQSPSPGGTSPAPGQGTGSASTISGTILQCDPSGVTIQTANGGSQTFSWGSASLPADLQPGDNVQITYQGSTVVSVSK